MKPMSTLVEEAAAFFFHLYTQREVVSALPPELKPRTAQEAYDIQDLVHDTAGWPIGVLKVGATSDLSQQVLQVSHPIAGRVPADGVHHSGSVITCAHTFSAAPKIECEFAMRVGSDGHINAVAPAIELVDPRLSGSSFSGLNTIADNAGGRAVVLGAGVPPSSAPGLSSFEVELFEQDTLVATGNARAINGGPESSVSWILDHERARGRHVEPETWIITGTCTGLHPSIVGNTYTAKFGPLGSVAFTLN